MISYFPVRLINFKEDHMSVNFPPARFPLPAPKAPQGPVEEEPKKV